MLFLEKYFVIFLGYNKQFIIKYDIGIHIMKLDLRQIFEMQAALDRTIQNNHNVTYDEIFEKIKIITIS